MTEDISNIREELLKLSESVNLEQLLKDALVEELKNYHSEQMNTVLIHPDIHKYLTKKLQKKIKRRFSYDVSYWNKENTRISKYFESAKKARNYANYIHNSDLMKEGDYVRMEKTFCYREFPPKHKWYYCSWKPNQFICVERW